MPMAASRRGSASAADLPSARWGRHAACPNPCHGPPSLPAAGRVQDSSQDRPASGHYTAGPKIYSLPRTATRQTTRPLLLATHKLRQLALLVHPAVPLRKQVVEDADQVQALACREGGWAGSGKRQSSAAETRLRQGARVCQMNGFQRMLLEEYLFIAHVVDEVGQMSTRTAGKKKCLRWEPVHLRGGLVGWEYGWVGSRLELRSSSMQAPGCLLLRFGLPTI